MKHQCHNVLLLMGNIETIAAIKQSLLLEPASTKPVLDFSLLLPPVDSTSQRNTNPNCYDNRINMVSIHGAMTDERKKRIWFLWKQGHPMAFIAKDIMKPPATVYSFLEYHGGIEPDIRCRKATDLTLQEREYISRSLAIGNSLRAISRYLNRAPSTISREVSRNGGIHKYRAYLAEQLAFKNAKRPKPLFCKPILL